MKTEPKNINREKYMVDLKLFVVRDEKGFFIEGHTGRTYVCPEIAPKYASKDLALQACAHGDTTEEFSIREHINWAMWHGYKGGDELHSQWRKEIDAWYDEWQKYLLGEKGIIPIRNSSLRNVPEDNYVITSPKWSGFSNPPSMEVKYFYCDPEKLPKMFRKKIESGDFTILWGKKVI